MGATLYCILTGRAPFSRLVYPLATNEWQLILFRVIVAVGTGLVAVMLSACIQDFPQERSRGRWIGLTSIFNGLGVIFMAVVLAKLPAWYVEWGASAVAAGRYAFWSAALLCAIAAMLLAKGLPSAPNRGDKRVDFFRRLAQGLRLARSNSRLVLVYGAAFIGRGDLAVVGTFFSLWLVQAGSDAGVSTGQSLARAGMLFGLIQFSALLWAFFMGMLADRLNRVVALIVALLIAAAGYSAMGQIDNPLSLTIVPVCILLGMGETSVVVAGGALLGQEAPGPIRGAVVGLYGLSGGLGIMAATFFGGLLFDWLGPTSPFVMMGIANGVLAAMAAGIVLTGHHRVQAD